MTDSLQLYRKTSSKKEKKNNGKKQETKIDKDKYFTTFQIIAFRYSKIR